MSLARSIALQGIGYGALAVVLQGFSPVEAGDLIQAGESSLAAGHFQQQVLARRQHTEASAERRRVAEHEAEARRQAQDALQQIVLADVASVPSAPLLTPLAAHRTAQEPISTTDLAEPMAGTTVTEQLVALQAHAAEMQAAAQEALADKERANQNRAAILIALLLAN